MTNKKREVPSFEVYEISPKQTKYCLCIPIINEGGRIEKELERAKINGVNKVVDIIICDGGSKDGSTNLEKLRINDVNTLLVKTGDGKQGAQLRMGISWALDRGYDGIITIDGNNKDSIEDVFKFVKKLDEGYDFIQGSRYAPGGLAKNTPVSRNLAVKFIHAPIISLTAGKRYTDTTSAFRGYSKKYLLHDEVNVFRHIFKEYELLAYLSVKADQLNLRTCEVGVSRIYPKGEKIPTKISPIKGNMKLLKTLFLNMFGRYEEKPKISKNILFILLFIITFFIIFAFRAYAYSKMMPYTLAPDSISYDRLEIFDLFKKGPDSLRVPVYPFILNVLNLITKNYLILIVKVQIILSFISLFFMYKIVEKLSNAYTALIMVFIYGVSISLFSFDTLILTESLSLSFFVFWIYFVLKFVEKKRIKELIIASLIGIFLVFLKPIFAVIPCVVFGYVLFSFFKKKNLYALKCLIVSLIPIVLILSYIMYFNQIHGVKTLSLTSVNQKFIISLQRNYSNKYTDNLISPIILSKNAELNNKDYWAIVGEVYRLGISPKQLDDYNSKVFKANTNRIFDDNVKVLLEQKYGFLYYYFNFKPGMENSRFIDISLFIFPMISVFNLFVFSILYLILIVFKILITKKIPSIDLFFYIMLFYPLLASITLTNAEYPRTAITSFVIIYIIIGMLIQYLGNKTVKLPIKNEFLGDDE